MTEKIMEEVARPQPAWASIGTSALRLGSSR
jgi:hypothetical protein